MKKWQHIGSLGALLLIAGCIPFSDLGEYWIQGMLDPAIEGHWQKQDVEHRFHDEYFSFEKQGDHYRYIRTQANQPQSTPRMSLKAKSLTVGESTFLMLQSDTEGIAAMFPPAPEGPTTLDGLAQADKTAGGGLQRYSVSEGALTLYYLDERVLVDAIKSGRVAGTLPKRDDPSVTDMSPPTIAILNEDSIHFLKAMLAKPEHWKKTETYRKVADLNSALTRSRTYPTTTETSKRTTLHIEQLDLAYFSGTNAEILQRHLAASPEWKVFDERGEVVGYSRTLSGDRWTVSLNGYKTTGHSRSRVQTRKCFRFTQEGGGPFSNEYNRDMTVVVGPQSGKTNLRLRKSNQGVESYLAVGQPDLWFEFFEQTKKEDREYTRETLDWLAAYLREVKRSQAQIPNIGFVPKLMPDGGVRNGKPTLDVLDGFQGGIYDVFAWVNPGMRGQAFLRVYNVQSDQLLSADRVFGKSNEYIGWSEDADQLFFYNAHVTIYEGDWDHHYAARFELWHRSSTGEEVKLVETTRTICGWQR
jgi:hypothetical protein